MIRKLFRILHKITGLALSLLFLMWFLSGIVMIWHSFPKASAEYRMQRAASLQGELPALKDIYSLLPDSIDVWSVTIQTKYGRPVAALGGKGFSKEFYLDSLTPVESFSENMRMKVIQEWCDAPIVRTDTLWAVDQWIPFERWKKQMPIFRYHFDDQQKHQLYMTSNDGKVIQFTDKDSRFWAWLGAIPHWVYFTLLRQHQNLWTKFVIWSASIGCVMCLLGMVTAIFVGARQRKQGFFRNPYKKRWYRWHFVSGLVFGFFAITFAFSGVMSMTDLPQWLKKEKPQAGQQSAPRMMRGRTAGSKALKPDTYKLDYRLLLESSDTIKEIGVSSWKNAPYYKVVCNNSVQYVDASDSSAVKPFVLTENMITEDASARLKGKGEFTVSLLEEYNTDYFARKKEKAPLPVYMVKADDYMNTCIYYNPTTLQVKQVNDDSRVRSFLYGGLHRLDIKFLTDRPVLWHIVMLVLLAGGSFLSLTGVVLTVKWIRRKLKHK